jgi:hypothetical protein
MGVRHLLVLVLAIGAACTPASVDPAPSPRSAPATATVARRVSTATPSPAPTPPASTLSPTGPTAKPAPTVRIIPALAVGSVPEAGTLIVRGAAGALYRYDGVAGTIEQLTDVSAWTPLQETAAGVFEMGLQGGVLFVPWRGAPSIVACGSGASPSVSRIGACASVGFGTAGGAFARYPSEVVPRQILPADWQPQAVAWDPDSRRLAVLRFTTDPAGYQVRAHDALWILERDGSLRRVYEPCCGAKGIALMRWSPSGDLLALLLSSGCAGCDGQGGNPLELIDPVTGRLTELGPTPGGTADFSWSPSGAIAFVRGTLSARAEAALIVRTPAGAERQLETGSYSPTWDPTGERLAWARPDGTAVVLVISTGERTTVTCGDQAVVGARFANSGNGLLLLCRRADPNLDIFDLFFETGGTLKAMVTDLGGGLRSVPPDIRQLVAWENGAP